VRAMAISRAHDYGRGCRYERPSACHPDRVSNPITELASASGAVAAVLVTSQVEHLITAAHAKQTPMLATGRELRLN
jgi:hypothetical protein